MKLKQLLVLVLFIPDLCFAQEQSQLYQILFRKNDYKLSEINKQFLSAISDSLLGKSNFIIYINGHTDSDADSRYNHTLSLNRSIAVKNYLTEKGVNDSLFIIQALGEENPLVANTTPIEKAKNRRVELYVLYRIYEKKEIIFHKQYDTVTDCNRDTLVELEGGYKVTLSVCDWEKNKKCLTIIKSLTYKFISKENWLKKHLGFKNYEKIIRSEPHYNFLILSCQDSCFSRPAKLYIPQYQAPGLTTSAGASQKKNNKNAKIKLVFKQTKIGSYAYYVADIYCPGMINCYLDKRCTHPVSLYFKRNTRVLAYSYSENSLEYNKDTVIQIIPENQKKITTNYRNAFFNTILIKHHNDTIQLKDIPIEQFAHNRKKINSNLGTESKSYFFFIPYRKKHKCMHYTKYKLRVRDIKKLQHFNLQELSGGK